MTTKSKPLKIGQKVTFKSAKTGIEHAGKIDNIREGATGGWVDIKRADGRTSSVRPSQVQR